MAASLEILSGRTKKECANRSCRRTIPMPRRLPTATADDQVGRAVEVAQIHWTPGTVEYEGEAYAGVTGGVTFTVPQLAVDTYRLAESIENEFTGCHVFALIDVVAQLPDTAVTDIEAAPRPDQALAAGAALLLMAVLLRRLRARGLLGQA